MFASVVIIIVVRSVTVSYPVQDCSDDVCAGLLKEADGPLDRSPRSLSSLDDEANPIEVSCQQEGIAYGIDRRRVNNHAIIVAKKPPNKSRKRSIRENQRRLGAMAPGGNEIQVLHLRWRDRLLQGCHSLR